MIGRMTSTAAAQSNPGAIEKVLGPKREEFIPVAWSFAYFFCVLSSYYIIGTFVTMMFATSAFGWVASRYPRRVFLPWVYLFFISNILIFWFVFSEAVFFIWLSVFNLFVVSVFWSFMADIYTREQGRRLFGLITSGGSIGALIGGVDRRCNYELTRYQYWFSEPATPVSRPVAGCRTLYSSTERLGAWRT
jgi:AAA family ATP:ADP antiporter